MIEDIKEHFEILGAPPQLEERLKNIHLYGVDDTQLAMLLLMINPRDSKTFHKDEVMADFAKLFVDCVGGQLSRIDNQLFMYNKNEGIYEKASDTLDKLLTHMGCGSSRVRAEHMRNITNFARYRQSASSEYVFFDNGIFNMKTKEFIDHTPELVSFTKIQAKYRPNLSEPNIEGWTPIKWLEGMTNQPDLLKQVMLAVINNRKCRRKCALFIDGKGLAGKGTVASLLISIVGRKHTGAMNIKNFDGARDKFAMGAIVGKALIVGDENTGAYVKESDNFKSAVSHEQLSIREMRTQPYMFKPEAFILQLTNMYPRFKDTSSAVKNRFVILEFTGAFDKPDSRIKDDYVQRADVVDYVATYIVDNVPDFSVGDWVESNVDLELMKEFENHSNTVGEFIQMGELTDSILPTKWTYLTYQAWCEGMGYKSLGRNKFVESMKNLQWYVKLMRDVSVSPLVKAIELFDEEIEIASPKLPNEDLKHSKVYHKQEQ